MAVWARNAWPWESLFKVAAYSFTIVVNATEGKSFVNEYRN